MKNESEMNMNELWISTCNIAVPSSRISPLRRIISKIIFYWMWRLILDFCFTSHTKLYRCLREYCAFVSRGGKWKFSHVSDERQSVRNTFVAKRSVRSFISETLLRPFQLHWSSCHVRSVSLSLCTYQTVPTYLSSGFWRKWGRKKKWFFSVLRLTRWSVLGNRCSSVWSSSTYFCADYPNVWLSFQLSLVVHVFFLFILVYMCQEVDDPADHTNILSSCVTK